MVVEHVSAQNGDLFQRPPNQIPKMVYTFEITVA